VKKHPQQNSCSTTTIGDPKKTVINRLFATMKVTYRFFLKDQEEELVKRSWLSHLDEFESDQIEKAARLMVDRHPSRDPTIGEFRALIREVNTARPEHQDAPLRITQQGNTEVGNKALDQMRRLLGAKTINRGSKRKPVKRTPTNQLPEKKPGGA
jgi:hypothetical protein